MEIVPLEIEALYVTAPFLPNFSHILYNSEQKGVYLAAPQKLKVSVLSAIFKKWRFCNFTRSYTKRSPSEKCSETQSYSGLVNGASWGHFKPRKTKIGQKCQLCPFFTGPFNCYISALKLFSSACG